MRVLAMEGTELSFDRRMDTMYKSVYSMSIMAISLVGRHAPFSSKCATTLASPK